jgi:hypothetical protein
MVARFLLAQESVGSVSRQETRGTEQRATSPTQKAAPSIGRLRFFPSLHRRIPIMKDKMHLAFDLSWTHLQGRWRLPGSWTGRNFPDMQLFKEVASIAERGRIDMIFFGDSVGVPSTWRGSFDEAVHWGIGFPRQDMSPFIAVLAQDTKHVGFGLTYS